MSFMLVVYIPCKDKEEATKISKHLLDKKLIACANLFPVTSLYIWKKNLETADEFVIFAKTTEKKYTAIKKEIGLLHSYECPCIIAWKIDKVNSAYEKWVRENVG